MNSSKSDTTPTLFGQNRKNVMIYIIFGTVLSIVSITMIVLIVGK